MKRVGLGVVAVLAACLGVSSLAQGAAALANGAATSAKPTAKDTAKKQIQIAADPVGIIDFQFTLHYDPLLLHVATNANGAPLIEALNGYTLGVRNNPEATTYAIDATNGFVTVRGYWPVGNGEVPYEETNVYDVTFQLNDELFPGVPLDADTPFIIYSMGVTAPYNPFGRGSPDKLVAGNIINGVAVPTRTYTAGDSDNPILTNNSGLLVIGTDSDTLPEPAAMGLVAPALLLLRRRRSSAR